jgi:conjugative transfer signal peptidase TraF
LIPIAVTGLIITGAVAAWDNGDWRLNTSPSEPMGIWSITPVTPATRLRVGDIVTVCPTLPTGYHYGWLMDKGTANACPDGRAPFLKTIVASAGDTVRETSRGVIINGHPLPDSRPLPFTTSEPQVRLPQWRGVIKLKAGQYWAYGAGDPRYSFDSRYWGPFTAAQVRGIAKSVLSWKYGWTPKVKN